MTEEDEKAAKCKELQEKGQEFRFMILDFVPQSREQEEALLKVDEAVMWGNKGIQEHDQKV